MQSSVTEQLIEFFEFVFIGIVIALIFDFFRAYRKIKKVKDKSVIMQDILFFLIVSIILVFSNIYILNSDFRIYIIMAVLVGILIYIAIFSKYFLKIYTIVIKLFFDIISFIFIPFKYILQIICKIYSFLNKYIKKYCKKFFYVIFFMYKKLFFVVKSTFFKRGLFCMKKMSNEKASNKKGRIKISVLFLIAFMGYCVYVLYDQQVQINKYNSQISMYKGQIDEKNDTIYYYNNQKSNIDSDEYIESVARNSLGLVKPYEKIFVDANK